MIFPDYHVHSSFSSDSSEDIINIIDTAINKGMTSICITDHYDMDFPILKEAPDMTFDLDIKAYYEKLSEIREMYKHKIDLRIGVELGLMKETLSKLASYHNEHSYLDFIIASTHLVDGMDPYYPEYFEGKTEHEAYGRYFEEELYNVKNFTGYNVYGHVDYITRYGKNKSEKFRIADYYDIFKEMFTTIVQNGKGIEINTGSLYKNMPHPHPHHELLKLYKDCGGEIITIGSDAHKSEYIGYGFDFARDYLTSHGFKYYTTFKKQQPYMERI